MKGYVCTFRGRRDSYQVPLALEEAGMLDQFITDAYALSWVRSLARFTPEAIRAKIDFRREPRIPAARVCCLWATTALEHLRHRLGYAPMETYGKLDPWYSRAAGRRAARNRSDLFLYSPYAWDAFTRSYAHTPRKVMFQYHPHPVLEARILTDDGVLYPGIGQSFSGTALGQAETHEADAWKHADLIFCASSFTRRSLLEAGADAAKCLVVPYGIELPPPAEPPPMEGDEFRVLFVGSGGQRKGLHHLLLAWQQACLPTRSHLTLVCRVIDHGIATLAASTPRVTLLQGVSLDALTRLYHGSSVMAMPSLVEGFGQVYLEALAQGCPVLGTVNTGLPDLGDERDGIFLVPPSDVNSLAKELERLARLLPTERDLRTAARSCAGRFSWETFRATLCARLTTDPP